MSIALPLLLVGVAFAVLHGAMLRRGFSSAVIFKVLNGLLEAGDDEGI